MDQDNSNKELEKPDQGRARAQQQRRLKRPLLSWPALALIAGLGLFVAFFGGGANYTFFSIGIAVTIGAIIAGVYQTNEKREKRTIVGTIVRTIVSVTCGALFGGLIGLIGVHHAIQVFCRWDEGISFFIGAPVGALIGGISGLPFGVGHKRRGSLGMGIGGLSGLVIGACLYFVVDNPTFLRSSISIMSPVIGAVLGLVIGLRYDKEWSRRRPSTGESVSGNGEEKPGGA